MIITHEQMARLQTLRVDAFRQRLREHLAAEFPQARAQLGADGLARNVDDSIDRAATLGITSERGIAKFLETSMDLDPAAKVGHVYDTVRSAWLATLAEPARTPS